jgi:hypothetical protein
VKVREEEGAARTGNCFYILSHALFCDTQCSLVAQSYKSIAKNMGLCSILAD